MDLHEKWPHRWLTPKAEPRNSNIHRYGIFAIDNISIGEPVNAFGGIAVPRSEIYEYRKLVNHAGVQVSDDFFLVPTSTDEIKTQGIFNHSCEPNVGFNSSVTMIAIRDIMDVHFFDDNISKFIASLEKQTVAKVLRTLDLLEKFGNRLGMPHSKPLKNGLFELRIRGAQEVRIIYVFHRGGTVLLHGFAKKTNKISDKDYSVALEKRKSLD